MSEKLDAILQGMAELTATVKDHQDDPATLDKAQIEAQFKEQIDEMVETKVKAELASRPVYRVPGAPIGPDVDLSGLNGNKYGYIVRGIARDGAYKVGTHKIQPVDFMLANMLLTKAHNIMPDSVHAPSDDLKAALKAMTSTGTATGAELVPTEMAAQLWQDFFLASRIVGLFTTIDMPTNPFDVPLGLGDATWRKAAQNTALTASDLTTGKSTLTATELAAEINWSYSLQEDSVVALMPAVRDRLAISGAEAIDAFMLNADATDAATGNINLDNADPSADAYYLSAGQDGIRHQWLVDAASGSGLGTDAGGDALADADITGAMGDMGKYAASPDQCAMICDVATYLNGFLKLSEVTTVDKYGPQAVVLSGELGKFRGIPIIVSASAPLTKSDGKADATGNTLGQISIVNRRMWYVGFRRNLLIEVDRDIRKRQYILVVSLREAVGAHGTRASNTHTAGIYNILV